MANIFNLERPTQIDMETGAKKSAIFKSPIVVNVNNNNTNLHHRVQSVIRRHLSLFINPEMHKSLLDNYKLNEAAYAKQLMEYLELKSFDSIEIINACDMNNILGAGFGESIAKV